MALCQTAVLNPARSFGHLHKVSARRSALAIRLDIRSVCRLEKSLQAAVCARVQAGCSPVTLHAERRASKERSTRGSVVKGSRARSGHVWRDQAGASSAHICPLCRVGSGPHVPHESVVVRCLSYNAGSANRRKSAICCSPDSPGESALEDPPPRSRPDASRLEPPFHTAFDSPQSLGSNGLSNFDSPGLSLDIHIPPFEDPVRPARTIPKPGLDEPSLAHGYREKDGVSPDVSLDASSLTAKRSVTDVVGDSQNVNLPVPQEVAGPPVSGASLEDDPLDQGSMWEQAKRIMAFAGPALGIWLGNPTMSLVDTAVIGTSSSLELAALGPGTALSDGFGHLFMFLSVATSNLIATSIAEKDPEGAARSLSRALFIALVCGVAITIICETLHTPLLKAFVGKNVELIPAARVYVQIRGLAWPAVLATMVAQSACLGMQDAWGPLRVLAVAASVNCLGDILLCSVFKMGIAGAAWATAASQVVGCVLMIQSLRKRSTIPLYLSVPRLKDLVVFMAIAGPTLITMLSKVSFYTLMTFVCTAHGTATGAGHQVMIGLYAFFAVFGEPLCQTAQSFIPEFIRGANRSLHKARKLLLSLMVMGGLQGLVLGTGAGLMPWLLPQLFTSDPAVVDQMRRSSFQIFAACTISGMNLSMEGTLLMRCVSVQIFLAVVVTPVNLSMEGTLLAGRDLIYLAISMVISFSIGASALLMGRKRNMGLGGIWWCLVGFQALRFMSASFRLSHPKSVVGGLRTRSKGAGHVPVVFGK